VAYSTGASSIVLIGKVDPDTQEWNTIVFPELQNRGVISVVLGDYHYGALLEDGKLLTWGQANGCGLGNPFTLPVGVPGGFKTEENKIHAQDRRVLIPTIEAPTEVRFDHGLKQRRETFVFGVAAAGWQMGALVIDLGEVRRLLYSTQAVI
jgi:SCF-associated factor 1